MAGIWVANGVDVALDWNNHISYSFDGLSWQNVSKDGLGVYFKKVKKNTSSPIAKKDISYVILLRHASNSNVNPALEFDLADVQNQGTWSNSAAGVQVAMNDITTWLGDANFDTSITDIDTNINLLTIGEDQPHVSGDHGIMALAVRNDSLASFASTSGDYSPIAVDQKGRLITVGANGYVEANMTLDTAAYATGDVLTDTVALTSILSGTNGTGILQSITILDKDKQSQGLDIVILKTNVSLGTKNAVPNITDTNAEEILGMIRVASGDYLDVINSTVATKNNLGIGVKGDASDTIYLSMISRGTGTYTANGLRIIVTVIQD